MLTAGKAVKVSIYLTEGSTHHGASTYTSILDYLFFRGVSGATVLKGVAGFDADHRMHSSSIVEISDHLPLKIEFIEDIGPLVCVLLGVVLLVLGITLIANQPDLEEFEYESDEPVGSTT